MTTYPDSICVQSKECAQPIISVWVKWPQLGSVHIPILAIDVTTNQRLFNLTFTLYTGKYPNLHLHKQNITPLI